MSNIIEIAETIEQTTIAMEKVKAIIVAMNEAYNDRESRGRLNEDLIKNQRDELYFELSRLNQVKKAAMKQIASL